MKIKAFLLAFLLLPLMAFSQTVNIGDILCTDGSTVRPEQFTSSGKTAEGIVFYVDGTRSQGWAVSLEFQAVNTHWVTSSHYDDMYDIPELDNFEHSREAMYDLDGYSNTAIIRNAHGADWYPAAWSVDFDHGWYLPAAGQMRWLIAYMNEINASLAVVHGTMFVFDRPRWYWTSTERTEAHAVVLSQTGAVGNYPKWNYIGEYEIGVRAIKTFTIQPQSHHIGEVITTASGQKGVVYYVSPEDGTYWLVAMNDLPSTYIWGPNTDITDLYNYNANDQFVSLHGIHCGYDATSYMLEAMGTSAQYAASHVDLANGWHIPSVGQLSKLYAALPFIETSLADNGGTTLSNHYYWASTECSSDNAWAINFGDNLYTEGFLKDFSKTSQLRVRAVWSEPCVTPTPEPTLPDNIIETDCNRPLDGNTWSIQLLASHQVNDIASYAPIMAGDIDGNGVTDIVIAHYNGNNYRTNTLDVYSGIDLSLQYRFNIQDSIYVSNGPYAIMRYPKDDGTIQGAIFVHGYDKKIRSYAIDGTLLNVSDRATAYDGMVSFADFNGDGYPEVYSGSDIFDAATLKWLCSGPESDNHGLSFRGAAVGVVNHHRCYFTMSLASNVLGDAKQELICGNTIYNVNIVSRTNSSLNSVTVNKTITPPSGYSPDGHVSLVDLDLDGECEVLVTRCDTDDHTSSLSYFYAYKPSSGQILFQKSIQCLTTGYPLLGNIDNDPHPEIVFLEKQDYNPKIYCLRYTSQNGLETVWLYPHNDSSGQTGITLFDFNQDNIMEIVYRDSENLRIINGNSTTPNNLFTRRMAAGTGTEYPIIADINGDGSAEIVATGLLDQSANLPGNGGLYVFGSPGNWSPARPVWNQYMYHVTNVNEDLTIPTYCFDKATVFTAPDGAVRRPFNNFLQQAYYITPEGEPYNPSSYLEVNVNGTDCSTFTFHGVDYSESGNYEQLVESPDGCDTLYHITVSIGGTITHEWSQQACNHYVWNGTNYTEPGDYIQEFVTDAGCDSIVTLHLSFSDALEYDADTTACRSLWWNGQEYTEPGVYTQQFVDIDGCDSIVHLHLTFAGQPEAIPEIFGETEVNVSTDLIFGQYFYTIDSVLLATHYEWELEGADWVMDTDGTQCDIVVTSPDTAILKVKAWNDCGYSEQEITIHAGFFDVEENQGFPFAMYPNPAHDKVFIEAEDIVRIRLFDLLGQCLTERVTEPCERVELSLQGCTTALYLIEIQTLYGTIRTKLKISPQ